MGWATGVRFPAEAGGFIFSSLSRLASSPVCTGSSFYP